MKKGRIIGQDHYLFACFVGDTLVFETVDVTTMYFSCQWKIMSGVFSMLDDEIEVTERRQPTPMQITFAWRKQTTR